MTRKLHTSDRQAIDLLLDRAHSNGDGNGGDATFITTAAPQPRVQAVETILKMLEAMPATDPPADLVTRTLHRIAKSAPADGIAPTIPTYVDPTQPMA